VTSPDTSQVTVVADADPLVEAPRHRADNRRRGPKCRGTLLACPTLNSRLLGCCSATGSLRIGPRSRP
jgi:hypothetical protein